MEVQRVYDPEIVKVVWEDLWDVLMDDTPVTLDEVVPPINDHNQWYATLDEKGALVSLWYVHQLNHITWQIHTHFLRKFWGDKNNLEHGKAALTTIWEKTGAKKFYAVIPEYSEHVIKFAKRLGFKNEGRMKKSIQKDGVIYDQLHFGVYR